MRTLEYGSIVAHLNDERDALSGTRNFLPRHRDRGRYAAFYCLSFPLSLSTPLVLAPSCEWVTTVSNLGRSHL